MPGVSKSLITGSGSFLPTDNGLAHAISVLSETWICSAWMVLRQAEDAWIVSHVEDRHYGLEEGDTIEVSPERPFPLEEGVVSDRYHDMVLTFKRGDGELRIEPVRGHVVHRIIMQDGLTYGAIVGLSSEPLNASVSRSLPMISLLSELIMSTHSVCADFVEATRRHRQAETDACADVLTTLLNRRGWQRQVSLELSRQRRHMRNIFIIMIDVDNFKTLNDTKGHAYGDLVLQKLANCLKANVRESDVVARLGGDEFAILVCDTDNDGVTTMIKGLDAGLKKQGIECSFGRAELGEDDTWESGLQIADQDMYACKFSKKSVSPVI